MARRSRRSAPATTRGSAAPATTRIARAAARAADVPGDAGVPAVPAVPAVAAALDPPRMTRCDAAALAAVERLDPADALPEPPPLIDGEDGAACDALLAQIWEDVAPGDSIERCWVDDVVNLVWDIRRLRRIKASLVAGSAHLGVEKTLNAFLDWLPAHELAQRWAAREQTAVAQVDRLVAAAGLTKDTVTAQTFAARINEIERIDRMSRTAMMRRDAILSQVERYRAATAERLRRAGEAAAAYVAATRNAATRDAA